MNAAALAMVVLISAVALPAAAGPEEVRVELVPGRPLEASRFVKMVVPPHEPGDKYVLTCEIEDHAAAKFVMHGPLDMDWWAGSMSFAYGDAHRRVGVSNEVGKGGVTVVESTGNGGQRSVMWFDEHPAAQMVVWADWSDVPLTCTAELNGDPVPVPKMTHLPTRDALMYDFVDLDNFQGIEIMTGSDGTHVFDASGSMGGSIEQGRMTFVELIKPDRRFDAEFHSSDEEALHPDDPSYPIWGQAFRGPDSWRLDVDRADGVVRAGMFAFAVTIDVQSLG